jgi:hypothetical protein
MKPGRQFGPRAARPYGLLQEGIDQHINPTEEKARDRGDRGSGSLRADSDPKPARYASAT